MVDFFRTLPAHVLDNPLPFVIGSALLCVGIVFLDRLLRKG